MSPCCPHPDQLHHTSGRCEVKCCPCQKISERNLHLNFPGYPYTAMRYYFANGEIMHPSSTIAT